MAKNSKALKFIELLLNHEMVINLDKYEDQGVKVTTHTYDVLKISYEEIKRDFSSLREASKKIDFFVVIVGIIIHDLSKGSIRERAEKLSHSQMMLKKPDYIVKESEQVLNNIEEQLNLKIDENIKKAIIHVVLSHHGKWGKIKPNTKEAHIVHRADMYSAKYHRINPIAADKILKLMVDGLYIDEIAENLNCTVGVIKDRLKKAKYELRLKNTKQLIGYFKNKKKIPIGDVFFTKRIRETEKLIKSVNKYGFKNLVLQNSLINYLEDNKIFKKEGSNENKS